MDIIEITDPYTGEQVNYVKTATWFDGTAMTDAKCDGIIYKKFDFYYKRAYDEALNIKWFGAKGDDVTDDTQAFLDALAMLDKFGKGAVFCPVGRYKISQKLTIAKPLIGIRGEGMESSVLHFINGDGLQLSSYAHFSFATIEDLTIKGAGIGIGIKMPTTNFYFLNRFFVRDFDIGIHTDTAVLSKFTNFSIAGCRIGAMFTNGSYANTIHNGNINGCTEAGIIESGSRLIISMTDIEGIGIQNPQTGIFEGGVGIKTGYGTEIRDCHFETTETMIGLNSNGDVFIDNCVIAGCKNGIKQLAPGIINGRYRFKSIRFAGCTTEFDIPATTIYQVEDCVARTAAGAEKNLVINASPFYGTVKDTVYTSIGYKVTYKAAAGLEVNGKEVLTGITLEQSINPGNIAANSTVQSAIAAPSGVSLDQWTGMTIWNIVNYDIPAGLVFTFYVKTSGTEVGINITNTTSADIYMESQIFRVRVI